jgi:hypothetical protein
VKHLFIWLLVGQKLVSAIGCVIVFNLTAHVSESISARDREIKDIMSAHNVSVERARDLYENARECRRKAKMKRS